MVSKEQVSVDGTQDGIVARYFPGIGCDSSVMLGLLGKLFGKHIGKVIITSLGGGMLTRFP
jgi:hypothetical protein